MCTPGGSPSACASDCTSWRLDRFATNPLLQAHGLPGDANNINGPSVLLAPPCFLRPLGRYYMYLASHSGKGIRLAVADSPQGPWRSGVANATLQLSDTLAVGCQDHVASPDVHLRPAPECGVVMYFHCCAPPRCENQPTYRAVSEDGLTFRVDKEKIAPDFYLRAFRFEGRSYAIAKRGNTGGVMYAARPAGGLERLPGLLPRMRHAAVVEWRHGAYLFYSALGDAPESLLVVQLNMTAAAAGSAHWVPPFAQGQLGGRVLVPTETYEGAHVPTSAARSGKSRGARRALQDPHVVQGDDGQLFLFYIAGGERVVAGGTLRCRHHWRRGGVLSARAVVPMDAAATAAAAAGRLQLGLASSHCDIIRRSSLFSPACGHTDALQVRPLLLTATGRSGTTYVSQVLSLAGLRLGHDMPLAHRRVLDGAVSWPHVFNPRPFANDSSFRRRGCTQSWSGLSRAELAKCAGCAFPWSFDRGFATGGPGHLFRHVVQVVRSPLEALTSRWELGANRLLIVSSACYAQHRQEPRLTPPSRHELWQVLQHWVLWNTFVEAVAEESVHVEATDEGVVGRLAQLAGLQLKRRAPGELDALLRRVPTNQNSAHTRKPNATLRWAALAGIDYEFAAMAQLMAMRWGFNVHPQDLLPPLAGTPPTAWPQQVCALNDAGRWECALEKR